MKKVKSFIITLGIVAALLVLAYGYYRYTNYYYGEQFYKDCTITVEEDSYTFSKGETLTIPVTVDNHSRVSLSQKNNYFLSYRLYDASGKEIADGERTEINVAPFQSDTIPMIFEVPEAGDYRLEIDVVREGYYWHKDLGGKTAEVSVTIKN